ncbi:hypothetical protein HanIR_Chr08g0344801 [Helianthus annuus]|nr:hypothetical protein HanIR_Chr08g0344801 [Helianthus annuus]
MQITFKFKVNIKRNSFYRSLRDPDDVVVSRRWFVFPAEKIRSDVNMSQRSSCYSSDLM